MNTDKTSPLGKSAERARTRLFIELALLVLVLVLVLDFPVIFEDEDEDDWCRFILPCRILRNRPSGLVPFAGGIAVFESRI
jgi:hypothetical protein